VVWHRVDDVVRSNERAQNVDERGCVVIAERQADFVAD